MASVLSTLTFATSLPKGSIIRIHTTTNIRQTGSTDATIPVIVPIAIIFVKSVVESLMSHSILSPIVFMARTKSL